MTEDQYMQLCEMAKVEYELAVRTAKAQLDETLSSLNRIRELWHRSQQTARTLLEWRHGSLAIVVKDAVAAASGGFTLYTISDLIAAKHPEVAQQVKSTSISTALRRLADSGEIVVVDRGTGQRPTTYQKTTRSSGLRPSDDCFQIDRPRESWEGRDIAGA